MTVNSDAPKAKISILTPVHIGTGNNIEPVCYLCHGHTAERYTMEDLLQNIPAEKLLNVNNLRRLSFGSDSKKDFYSLFQLKPGTRLRTEPLYSLYWPENTSLQTYLQQGSGSKKPGSMVVAEQIKDLGRPIIPGSTLKGAIECAFKYVFLKDHYAEVSRNMESFCSRHSQKQNGRFNGWASTPALFYLELVYSLSPKDAEKYEDFVKDLYGCLEVSDISFEEMELLDVYRFPRDPDRKNTPMGLAEHIRSGCSRIMDYPIRLNTFRMNNLEKKYSFDSIQKELKERFCSLENLQNAVRVYTADMVNSDNLPDDMDPTGLERIQNLVNAPSGRTQRMLLRVGKNTSYFFKTVSRLFEENNPDLFVEYFAPVFAPVNPASKNGPDPEDFPRSFAFALSPDDTWPAGFIQIEYADGN